MDNYLTLVPKEITGIIFSYLDNSTRDQLLLLPEFQFIDTDYFWYLQTSYDFPKYFAPEAKEGWKKIYQGLYFLFHPRFTPEEIRRIPSLIYINNILPEIPDLMDAYLNFTPQTKEKIKQLRLRQSLDNRKFFHFDTILNIFTRVLQVNHPETFKYLVKYNFIKSSNIKVIFNIITWILNFDDPDLISKIPIANKSELYKRRTLRPRIFDAITKELYPNITSDDYLDMLIKYNLSVGLIDHITSLIKIDTRTAYNFFHQMIMQNVHPENLRYIWYKLRYPFNTDEMDELHQLATQRNYLIEEDLTPFSTYHRARGIPLTFK